MNETLRESANTETKSVLAHPRKTTFDQYFRIKKKETEKKNHKVRSLKPSC